jgi:hypothetical protein
LLPPDPDDMNRKRAEAAYDALLSFARSFGETDDRGMLAEFDGQNLSDFLADLAHYCDREGLQFMKFLSNARSNYLEETDSEGRQFAGLKLPQQ